MKQRRQQFASWMEVAELYARIPNYQMGRDDISRVGDTETVYYAALALDLAAGASTIEAAWNLYRATRDLDLDGLSYIKTDDNKVESPSSQALLITSLGSRSTGPAPRHSSMPLGRNSMRTC